MLLCHSPLRSAVCAIRMTASLKCYIFLLVCLRGLTALIIIKMIEMANHIKGGGFYCSQNLNMTIGFINETEHGNK